MSNLPNTLVVTGYIRQIDLNDKNGTENYFAKIVYVAGSNKDSDSNKQYMSCFFARSLTGLARAAFETQVIEDAITFNVLGAQRVELTIVDPRFEINSGGYLDGTGILTQISFKTPAISK